MPALPQPGLYPFGVNPDGDQITRAVISDGTLAVSVLSQGVTLQDVRLAGVAHGLTVGTDTLPPYVGPLRSCGALMGPVVNRISNGRTEISGKVFEFERNQDGLHTRHCGAAGVNRKGWELAECDDTSVTFELSIVDGEGGFPGNRAVASRLSLPETGVLELRVAMTTDADTIVNFANHAYWNLDGTPTYEGHRLTVAADRRCLADAGALVTGEVEPVEGTFFDFREGRVLSPGQDPLIDVNMCVADQRRALTEVLRLEGTSGVTMTVETTEPGVQLYDGSGLGGDGAPGHDGRPIGAYSGFAIEPQGWPDACNHAHFPSILLRAGHSYEQVTRYRFEKG